MSAVMTPLSGLLARRHAFLDGGQGMDPVCTTVVVVPFVCDPLAAMLATGQETLCHRGNPPFAWLLECWLVCLCIHVGAIFLPEEASMTVQTWRLLNQ